MSSLRPDRPYIAECQSLSWRSRRPLDPPPYRWTLPVNATCTLSGQWTRQQDAFMGPEKGFFLCRLGSIYCPYSKKRGQTVKLKDLKSVFLNTIFYLMVFRWAPKFNLIVPFRSLRSIMFTQITNIKWKLVYMDTKTICISVKFQNTGC